jgi:hypothetical protein
MRSLLLLAYEAVWLKICFYLLKPLVIWETVGNMQAVVLSLTTVTDFGLQIAISMMNNFPQSCYQFYYIVITYILAVRLPGSPSTKIF